MPDQLDVQTHVEVAAIRQTFQTARDRVAAWEPAPYPYRIVGARQRTPYLDEIHRPQPWLR